MKPEPEQQITNGYQLWPANAAILRMFGGVVLVVAVSLGIRWSVQQWTYHHSPEYTIELLNHADSANLEKLSDYLTPNGKRILKASLANAGGNPANVSFTGKTISGNLAKFGITTHNDEVSMVAEIILVRQASTWRFDEIWIETMDGHKVNMPLSFVMDHPNQAWVKMMFHNPEMAVEYAKRLVRAAVTGYNLGRLIAALISLG